MKKVLTLALALVMTVGAMAQKTYRLNSDKQDAKTESVRTLNLAKKSIDKDNIKKLNLSQAKAMSVEVTDISLANGELTATITPNAEVASYFYMAANPNNQEFAQYVQLLQIFGMTETDAVAALADNAEAPATGTQTVTMNAAWVAPGETNNVYVVALDANENAQMFTIPFMAPALGDEGEAAVTVNAPADSITTTSVYLTMTPNASTSYYYYLIYEDSEFAANNWNNDSVMNYFQTQAAKSYYELSGNLRVEPNEHYTVYTLAYNINDETQGIQTYQFATGTIGGHGTPVITVTVENVTAASANLTITPNSEVAYYYYLVASEADLQANGMADDAAVQAYLEDEDDKEYFEQSGTLNGLEMGTTYKVYAIAYNLDGTASSIASTTFTTESLGGSGLAEVTVSVEVVDGAATINTTMNDQTAYYYYAYFAGINGYDNDEIFEMVDGNAQRKFYENINIENDPLEEGDEYGIFVVPYNGNNEQGTPVAVRFTYNGVVSLADVAISSSISIYPNPAKNILNISAPAAINRVEMVNILGQKVYENATIGSENTTINVSDLQNGTYFVRIFCGNKIMTKKLIVK